MSYAPANQDQRSEILQDLASVQHQSFDELNAWIQDLPIGVLLQGPHAEVLLCNPVALQLLGLSEDQLLGKTSFDPDWSVIQVDGSPFPGAIHPVPQAILTKSSVNNVVMGVYRPLHKDVIWLRVNADPQVDPEGNVKQVICTFTEINVARSHVTEKTVESVVNQIMANVPTTLDVDEILKSALQGFKQTFDQDHSLAILFNQTATETNASTHLVSLEKKPQNSLSLIDLPLWNQLQQGHWVQCCQLSSSDVTLSKLELLCPLMVDKTLIGVFQITRAAHACFHPHELSVIQDVASQCSIRIRYAQLCQTTQDQIKALKHQNQLQEDFISVVSHELRAPSSNIRMALRLMAVAPSEFKKQEYYALALHECERQIELINDLLDMQQLTQPFLPVFIPIDLSSCLQSLVRVAQPTIQQKGLHLNLLLPEKVGILQSDGKCVDRIIGELLNNAVKYTDPHGVIKVEMGWDTPKLLRLSIANHGSIPEEDLPRIFDKFYRVPKSDRWRHGGNGLGLAIVKQLVAQLQGNIKVFSRDGWVCFTVWIPNQTCASEACS